MNRRSQRADGRRKNMDPDHVESLPARPPLPSPSPRLRRRRSGRPLEPHIVVATQNLSRMSGAIHALIQGGYVVTAYASPVRLLPRLHRLTSYPVSLLVIDGGLTPAFARAAAIAARATYSELSILLLATEHASRCADFMPAGVSVLRLPLSMASLLATAARLMPRRERPLEEGWST
jgi:hypothetical protein